MFSKKLKGFSTVEGIVASVIITVVMMLIYSVLSKTIDSKQTLILTKGVAQAEEWRSLPDSVLLTENYFEFPFEGGKTTIDITNYEKIPGLNEITFSIFDSKDKKVYCWNELLAE